MSGKSSIEIDKRGRNYNMGIDKAWHQELAVLELCETVRLCTMECKTVLQLVRGYIWLYP
jgi:hypothetical protein